VRVSKRSLQEKTKKVQTKRPRGGVSGPSGKVVRGLGMEGGDPGPERSEQRNRGPDGGEATAFLIRGPQKEKGAQKENEEEGKGKETDGVQSECKRRSASSSREEKAVGKIVRIEKVGKGADRRHKRKGAHN